MVDPAGGYRLSRRAVLRGAGRTGVALLALPPLEAMMNGNGTAYADPAPGTSGIESRFVLWFNGNGVPEKFWIPRDTGADFGLSPCLAPLGSLRDRFSIITGLDNVAAQARGPGNGHTNTMSGLMSCTSYTGRGAGGTSIDQAIAARIGGSSRFKSLQIGVANESFGESIQRNMSWSAANRPLAPEMLPHRLFDRLFGQRELSWITREKSVLDVLREDAARMRARLSANDRNRLDEHMASVRELEHAITSLPPRDYQAADAPDVDGDLRDYPRIAKLQSDLLVHAFAARQTRVASYMLTKCQSLTRFPWLGHTVLRHHDYTHYKHIPGTQTLAQFALRDICRWHVEELAYLLARLSAVPEGDGNLLDNTCVLFLHEHAEGNDHKNTGLSAILAGCSKRLRTGMHHRLSGTVGDLYLTLANDVLGADLRTFPTAAMHLPEILKA